MLQMIILKFTKDCNADCSFCAAPKEAGGGLRRGLDDWKHLLDHVVPHMGPNPVILWHGGEPMMLGPDFYWRAYEMAQEVRPDIEFAMQTNLLLYKSSVWGDLFRDVFRNGVSTSYEPGLSGRTLKGDPLRYAGVFLTKLEEYLDNGHGAFVIANLDRQSIQNGDHHKLYDMALRNYQMADNDGRRGIMDIRLNYRYPAGRAKNHDEDLSSPQEYGEMLLEIFDRWVEDAPAFKITPLDQMVRAVQGLSVTQCPFSNNCAGTLLGVEPNGETYTCSEFADMQDPEFCYGNIFEDSLYDILNSAAARKARRRQFSVPADCLTCEHYTSCQGGCMRDSVLYGRDLYGKTQYCGSWKMVFSRIKEALADGSLDPLLKKFNTDRYGIDYSRICTGRAA